MATSDDREAARGGQARFPKLIDPACFYSSAELADLLDVTEDTLAHWSKLGLKRPNRTLLKMKYQAYYGAHVLDFLLAHLEH